MSDLVSRVLAAIEEAERLAQDATTRLGGHQWGIVEPGPYRWGNDERDTEVIAAGKPIIRCDYERGGYLIASHVVHHDPQAVARRCTADRRTLQRHSRDHGPMAFCAHEMVPWPCEDFRDLADRYGISVEEETTGGSA